MRTDAELDRMHDAVVAKYPGGLTGVQFRQVTLESADEDGRVYPPSIADALKQHSCLLRMMMDGHIENRGGGYNKPYRWHITEKGRALLHAHGQSTPDSTS